MASDREKMEEWPLGRIADTISNSQSGSIADRRAQAELIRRQIVLQEDVAQMQKAAAQATIETAKYTRLNARYMLWSVIVLAAASVLNLVVNVLHISK